MAEQEYTPQQALQRCYHVCENAHLKSQMKSKRAVDSGKDSWEPEPTRGLRVSGREFRKRVPYTPQEALDVALRALEAYVIELPMFINSAASDFQSSAVGVSRQRTFYVSEPDLIDVRAAGERKSDEIEVQTETRVTPAEAETIQVKPSFRASNR